MQSLRNTRQRHAQADQRQKRRTPNRYNTRAQALQTEPKDKGHDKPYPGWRMGDDLEE